MSLPVAALADSVTHETYREPPIMFFKSPCTICRASDFFTLSKAFCRRPTILYCLQMTRPSQIVRVARQTKQVCAINVRSQLRRAVSLHFTRKCFFYIHVITSRPPFIAAVIHTFLLSYRIDQTSITQAL